MNKLRMVLVGLLVWGLVSAGVNALEEIKTASIAQKSKIAAVR